MSTLNTRPSTTSRTRKERRIDQRLRLGMMWPNSPTPNVTSKAVAQRSPDILDVDVHMQLAQAVERLDGIDYVFFADGYTSSGPASARVGHGEPCIAAPIWAPAVMAATRHIGVVTTMHTRYLEPAVLARFGANLDQLSGGRWGWNIVPGTKSSESDLFGLDDSIAHDQRYAMAAEAVQAVKTLWGSNGQPIAFDGEFYRFKGVPRGPSPVQRPHPLLFNAGVSPAGQDLIAELCDRAFFAVSDDLDQVRGPVQSLAERTEAHGRSAEEVIATGSVGIVVGATSREAEEKYEWLLENVDLDAAEDWARVFLSRSETYQSMFGDEEFENAVRKIGVVAGSRVLVGTGPEVAEQMIEINRQTGLRGFMLVPTVWTVDEIRGWAEIFPTLESAGVFTRPTQRGWSW